MALQQGFNALSDLVTRGVRLEEKVAAVDVGANVPVACVGNLLAQLTHDDLVLTPDVNAAQQRHVLHAVPPVVLSRRPPDQRTVRKGTLAVPGMQSSSSTPWPRSLPLPWEASRQSGMHCTTELVRPGIPGGEASRQSGMHCTTARDIALSTRYRSVYPSGSALLITTFPDIRWLARQRVAHCTRYVAPHPLRRAAPVTSHCTRYVALHPFRTGAMPTDRVQCLPK